MNKEKINYLSVIIIKRSRCCFLALTMAEYVAAVQNVITLIENFVSLFESKIKNISINIIRE